MRHLVLALAAAVCLTGCDRLQAVFTPVPDKINAAFPLPDEVELARTRLLAALEDDKPAREAAVAHFGRLMNARAVACSVTADIGRFDTAATIRRKVTDTPCFTRQDAQLEEWIAVRRIGLALRAPPLVPLAPLPARTLLPNKIDSFQTAHLASQANVLVLRGGSQQPAVALEVPSGKELSRFTVEGYNRPSLSPNGRLLAVPGVKTLRVLDVASNKPLWTSDKYDNLVGWAPENDLVVLQQVGTGAPAMLDTRTGRIDPFPATEKRLSWSLPAGAGRMLVGTYNSASLMEHARGADGVNQGQRLVWPSGQDLAWLDLGTGQQGKWQLSLFGANNVAQLADTVIAFDTYPPDANGVTTRLLDTGKGTIAPARDAGERGQVAPLGPRPGLVRRSSNVVALVTAMEAGEAQDVERAISEALAAREIAKLNDPYHPGFGAPNPGRTPEQQAMLEQLARQVRAMNTQSALRDGLPRETVEAIRRGRQPVEVGPAAAPAPAIGSAPPAVMPAPPLVGKTVLNVPADAKIAMLGVYQAAGSNKSSSRSGTVTVQVGPGKEPLVLVLSNYEKVNRMIRAGGRRIAAVLLSGYNEATVYGQGQAEVVRIGRRHVYKIDSRDFQELRREVARYVGPATPVFQGAYEGSLFQVR